MWHPSGVRLTRPRRLLVLALVSSILGTCSAGLAVGQDRGRTRDRGSSRAESAGPAEAEPDAPATEADDVDAESEVVSRGGEKVKVVKFSGLDVSGRLKSPQLLYFIGRIRAEFERPRLPHRSFVPEVERSTRTKSF